MKEVLIVFLAIIAILAGSTLVFENASYWNAINIFWTFVGIVALAGGLTTLWAKRRFKIR